MFCGGSDAVLVQNTSGVLREGSLQRYAGFFGGWKSCYYKVYQDGQLTWAKSPGNKVEGHFNVKHDCEMLRVGRQCTKGAPKLPPGAGMDNMFCMEVKGKSHYTLAPNKQELMEWLQALGQAKGLPPPPEGGPNAPPQGAPPPQGGYPPAGQPPPPGFQPGVTQTQGAPPPYQTQPQPGYPQQYGAQPNAGYPQQQGAARGYPVQQGGPRPYQGQNTRQQGQTVVVDQQGGRGNNDGFATGMLTGYMLSGGGGWGYGGYGYGWGGGWGHHHHGGMHVHESHTHFHDHDHYENQGDGGGGMDQGGMDQGGGFDQGGGYDDGGGFDDGGYDGGGFGGDDFGGGDFGGDDFGGDFGDF